MPFQKGNIPWIKGKHHSLETKKKISESEKGYKPWRYKVAGWNKGLKGVQVSHRKGKKYPEVTGEKSGMWKGDKVGISPLHRWVERVLGKPNECWNKDCVYPRKDSRGKLMLKPKRYHWSNISREYKRDVNDFQRLCTSCHKKYDMKILRELKSL